MKAFFALAALLAGQDVPSSDPAVTAAFSKLGEAARKSVDGTPSRILFQGECGNGIRSWNLLWAKAGDTRPSYWAVGPTDPEDPLMEALGDLCDAFGRTLNDEQMFEVRWSEGEGAVATFVGPVNGDSDKVRSMRAESEITRFFGSARVPNTGLTPRNLPEVMSPSSN